MVPLINQIPYVPQLIRPHLLELVSKGELDLKGFRHMVGQDRIRIFGQIAGDGAREIVFADEGFSERVARVEDFRAVKMCLFVVNVVVC